MNPRRVLPVLLGVLTLLGLVAGQFPSAPVPGNTSTGGQRPVGAGETVLPPAPPPEMPPAPPSPVAVFRRVLRSSPEEQQAVLASRPPKHRAYLEAQLREFSRLSPAECEARLQLLELRFHLLPLLNSPASNRVDQIQAVPARYRAAVKDRLGAWDALSPTEREGLLDDHAAASWLCRSPAGQPVAPVGAPAASAEPARLGTTLARWQGLSPAEKSRTVESLERFFQFDASQKDRALREMTRLGRAHVADFMTQLDELPAPEREKCLRALERFAGFPEGERRRFMQNAVRWATMSDEERRAWRDLQAKLPPLPPVLPPRPPLARAER